MSSSGSGAADPSSRSEKSDRHLRQSMTRLTSDYSSNHAGQRVTITSFRAMRARWMRDLAVPSLHPRMAATSSYERPSTSRRTRIAQARLQAIQRPVDDLPSLLLSEDLGRARRFRVFRIEDPLPIRIFPRAAPDDLPHLGLSALIPQEIPGDRTDPRPEVAFRIDPVQRPERAQEDLLRRVVRTFASSQEPLAQPVDHRQVAVDELRLRRAIAGSGPDEDLPVAARVRTRRPGPFPGSPVSSR